MVNNYIIPLSKPYLTKNDLNEIKKCFNSSWISSKSPKVEEFEKLFAEKVSQTKYAVAVNSGTSALFLALKVLGIGPGDEVIIPTFTMIATVNAVDWVGAKPVLVDCRSIDDFNIDTSFLEKKITKKTKAIIPVHIYGYPCDMEAINRLAKKYHLYVIEDAAEAMGTKYKGKNIGGLGDISCFSLYSNKIITTGNGGMVATNNKTWYLTLKQLCFFDRNEKDHFTHRIIGYNLVMSGLQAALGLSQLRRFERMVANRKKIFNWYRQYLPKRGVRFVTTCHKQEPNYWFPALIFSDKEMKERVWKKMEKEGIETRVFFRPVHMQPIYKHFFEAKRYPNAEYFYERGLLLPSFFGLTKPQVKHICRLIEENLI